jgi:hypothetical protein
VPSENEPVAVWENVSIVPDPDGQVHVDWTPSYEDVSVNVEPLTERV